MSMPEQPTPAPSDNPSPSRPIFKTRQPDSETTETPRTWRFAVGCLSSRSAPRDESSHPLDLSLEVAQGLADLLPILLCGEASAELMFEDASSQFSAYPDPILREALDKTCADERRHAFWLRALRIRLPAPASREPARRAATFLSTLYSNDLGRHLCRVAALDAAVCIVLATVCARHTPLARSAMVRDTFVRIRRDEGRHVRLSRRCIETLNISAEIEASERQRALSGFATLLSAHARPFAAIGVDPAAMLNRFGTDGAGALGVRRISPP